MAPATATTPAQDDAYTPILRKLAAQQVEAAEEQQTTRVKGWQSATGLSAGWIATLKWAGFVLATYSVAQLLLPFIMPSDPKAMEHLFLHVPMRMYQYSEAAFFTATVLNLLSAFYEETQEKRQLALLSMLIKGLSWHCDYLIVTGRAVVVYDSYNALLLPSRYVQWALTTPTMLFTISKISDFSPRRVSITMALDFTMILMGFTAALVPSRFVSALAFNTAMVCFYSVMYNLNGMLQSAMVEANSPHARTCLNITLYSSIAIWHLFPMGWSFARLGPWVDWLAEPMQLTANFGAKVVFSSCILYNNYVTLQQRRVEAQLAQEHRDRIKMVDDLTVGLQHKDEFISVIGHELRTPLNAVIKLSTAVSAHLGMPEYLTRHRLWMETVTRSARHLLGIINDIITMKAARSGIHLKQELVYVGRVVDHVLRTLTPLAQREVTVEKVVAKVLPPIVADERRVIQILSNVLGNALKFTERGKVCVRVRMDKPGHNVVIKIQDSGVGIPKANIPSLLQPFKQADMTSGRKYGGTGLGLSIANQLVKAHSGRLELESTPGTGTIVIITLPVLQHETVDALEAPFRAEYEAAGYSFDQLMSPAAAQAEGRRLVSFVAPDDVHLPAHMLNQLMPRGGGTATGTAASMVSSAEGSGRPRARAAGSAARSQGSYPSSGRSSFDTNVEKENFHGMTSGPLDIDEGDALETAAGGGAAGPPPMAVALISSLYDVSAQPKHTPTNEAVPTPMTGVPGFDEIGVQGGATAVAGASDKPLPNLPEMADEGVDGQEELEWDEYQGTWHRPARFEDGHDADKAYYSYENRVSYEYRLSLDHGNEGASFWKASAGKEGVVPSKGKGIIRRSIDHMRGSLGSERSASGKMSNRSDRVSDASAGTAVTPTTPLPAAAPLPEAVPERADSATSGASAGKAAKAKAKASAQGEAPAKSAAAGKAVTKGSAAPEGVSRNAKLAQAFGMGNTKEDGEDGDDGKTGRTSWHAVRKEQAT